MEREILFRGKLSHSGVCVEGNLIKDRNGNKYIIPFNVFEPDGHHLIIDSDEAWRVDPETVGQFTMRYDKNKNRIFEGCLVVNKNMHGKKWVVEYRTGSEYVGFVLKEVGASGISLFTSWNDIEIIENIYDNKNY